MEEKCPVMKHLWGPNYSGLRRLLPLGTAAPRAEQCISHCYYTRRGEEEEGRGGASFIEVIPLALVIYLCCHTEELVLESRSSSTYVTAQVKGRTNMARHYHEVLIQLERNRKV